MRITESLAKILKKGALVVNPTVVFFKDECVQIKINATEESGRNFYLFVAFYLTNICACAVTATGCFSSPFFKTSPGPDALVAMLKQPPFKFENQI